MRKSKTFWGLVVLSACTLVAVLVTLTPAKLSVKDKPLSEVYCNCVGDLDGNLLIDQNDADLMLAIINGEQVSYDPDCGDVNHNGIAFEIADCVLLQRMVDQYGTIPCN